MSFADLHVPGDPFVLPNAWDLGSARALVAAGFPALGTTSLGVAAAHGLADAARVAREPNLALATALAADRPGVPVTVDLEDGFSDDPGEVADLVVRLAGAGIAGVNLEDSTTGTLVDAARHAAKLTAVKRAAPDVFVNARTDTFWLGQGDTDETVRRLRTYAEAGADGVFAPAADEAAVAAVVGAVDRPLNVLASPTLTRDRLAALGVARISTGSLLFQAALRCTVDTALAVRDGRGLPPATAYDEVQSLSR